MLMSVEEVRKYINTDIEDAVLVDKLQALELLIRKKTNNNFQNRAFRFKADASEVHGLCYASSLFKVGDTVELSNSDFNSGLYTIVGIDLENGYMELDEGLFNESDVLVTKVVYPMDIKMGAINMLKWDIENREKVGIQSETISRHSVTYFNMDGDNSSVGYPKSVVGFLQPYVKARF